MKQHQWTHEPVIDRQQRYRLLIAASHFITWFVGRRFRRAAPLCFVTGYPKSGTTWATQMVADCLRAPYPQQSLLPVMCRAVVHGHQLPDKRLYPGVYVMRDGRDVMVSLYFYLSHGIPEGDHPPLTRSQKKWFPVMKNKRDVRNNLPAFIESQMVRPTASRRAHWGQHVLSYFDSSDQRLALMSYERMLACPIDELTQAIERITGSSPERESVQDTIDRFSFESLTGRRQGQESRKSFLRSGRSGDWRQHFSTEAAQVFDHHCGEAMRLAGYEADNRWIEQLKPGHRAAA